ncbi:MAG: transglycosylase domain-containing protein [Pseudomonadota bacterium]
MLTVLRLATRALEWTVLLPVRLVSLFFANVAFNPRLGFLRHIATAAAVFVLFALVLVYVVAPIRGYAGAHYLSDKLRYDAERWVATAIYDTRGDFAGTYDPRLDSQRDVNFTDTAIRIAGYTANPDHKSIPVRAVPNEYWRCLVFHEDRYLGTWRNPFGIDLIGVLKIPLTTIQRSIRRGRPSLGVGGSTLPMQFVRVIYKTPPSVTESPFGKLARKAREWWLAPVVYHELTRGGDLGPLQQWAANHLWLAQRTGGAPLHGVEVTSRIVFGKDAKDLSTAEQFVLASAVNKPIILLPGSDRLNRVRLDRWRYVVEVRARRCVAELIEDEEEQKRLLLELVNMASGPPDPIVRPRLQTALETHAPDYAKRAEANPRLRANVLLPAVRLGAREEMKQAYGFNWRAHVRGLTTSIDAAENLAFRQQIKTALTRLNAKYNGRLKPGFTLDPAKGGVDLALPDVVIAASDQRGRIVRYYETNQTAPYFGSVGARSATTGRYDATREGRAIASTGKILSAIAIANSGRDTATTPYLDTEAPARGLKTCRRKGDLRRMRSAEVAFACSLNRPLEWRTAKAGQKTMADLINAFAFNEPPLGPDGERTPPSTAAVRGLIAGAPRTVHHVSSVVLAALTRQGGIPQGLPSLIEGYDFTTDAAKKIMAEHTRRAIRPHDIIRPHAVPLLKRLLQSPLCYRANGRSHGTLKALANWCAARRPDLRLHFAKTGTQVNIDPDETVDVWATGGLQFTNGAAYSYVVMVGSGTPSRPFARALHSSQIAAPLLDVLLRDLARHARGNPVNRSPAQQIARVAEAQETAASTRDVAPVPSRRGTEVSTTAPKRTVRRKPSRKASLRMVVATTTHKPPNPFGSRSRNASQKRRAFSVEDVFRELSRR